VAELSCGHGQHVRHRPPFQLREWVLDPETRALRLGTPLECPLCDRAELPDGLTPVRSSTEWDEHTMPAGLRRAHRIATGTWGRIIVRLGQLRFVMQSDPALDVVLHSGSTQAIPPEVPHEVQPLGPVRFSIDFFSVKGHNPTKSPMDRGGGGTEHTREEGGEPACWAHLLCPDCGTVLDGGPHLLDCPATASGECHLTRSASGTEVTTDVHRVTRRICQ
jgi:tellurite methyltransferase